MSEIAYSVDYIVMDANKIYYKGPYGQVIHQTDPVFQKTTGTKRNSFKEEGMDQEETKIQASIAEIDHSTYAISYEKPTLRRHSAEADLRGFDPDSVTCTNDKEFQNLFYPKYTIDPVTGKIDIPKYAISITAPIPNADTSQPATIISTDGRFVHPTTVYPSQAEPSLVNSFVPNVKVILETDETEAMCD